MTQSLPAAPAPRPDAPARIPDAGTPDAAPPPAVAEPATTPSAVAPAGRRRSGFVTLGMVGTLALALSGCSSSSGSNPPSRCVDPGTLKVLDRHACTGSGTATAGRWYYCGSGSATALGGTFDKAATKRGGFGCPSGSSGSGGG
ncbi:hypothetical protein ACFWOG_04200 [Kitasatospora sp. NPDC058406]|uniref:hypothetical protein n=1 Tax=Kitasatospora sp. NPDC058406 TaxID=3346483 RepID=UPI003666FDCC